MLLSINVWAQTAFSLRYGTTQINANGISTTGTSLELQGETFLEQNYGLVFSLGNTNSESSNNVNQDGTYKPELELQTSFLNLGAFYYITKPFRVSGGVASHWLNVKASDTEETISTSTNQLGPFATVSYMLSLGNFAIGAQYYYSSFGDYSQSNISLILGLAF